MAPHMTHKGSRIFQSPLETDPYFNYLNVVSCTTLQVSKFYHSTPLNSAVLVLLGWLLASLVISFEYPLMLMLSIKIYMMFCSIWKSVYSSSVAGYRLIARSLARCLLSGLKTRRRVCAWIVQLLLRHSDVDTIVEPVDMLVSSLYYSRL